MECTGILKKRGGLSSYFGKRVRNEYCGSSSLILISPFKKVAFGLIEALHLKEFPKKFVRLLKDKNISSSNKSFVLTFLINNKIHQFDKKFVVRLVIPLNRYMLEKNDY